MVLLLPKPHHAHHLAQTVLSTSSHNHLLATLSIIYTDAYYLEVGVWLMLQGMHNVARLPVACLQTQSQRMIASVQWSRDATAIYVLFNKSLITVSVSYPTGPSAYPSISYFLYYLTDSDAVPKHLTLARRDEITLSHITSIDIHDNLWLGSDHLSVYSLDPTGKISSVQLMDETYISHISELHVPLFNATTLTPTSLHEAHTPSAYHITQCCSCSSLRLMSCITSGGGICFLRQRPDHSYQSTPHVFIMSERKNFIFEHSLVKCHNYAHLIFLSSSTLTEHDDTSHSVDVLHYKCQYSEIALSLELMWNTRIDMVVSETVATGAQCIISDDNIVVLVDDSVYCLNAAGDVLASYVFSQTTLGENYIVTMTVAMNQIIVTASASASVCLDDEPLLLPNSQSIDCTTHSEAPHRSYNGTSRHRRKSHPPSRHPVQREEAPVDLLVAHIDIKTCAVQPSAHAAVANIATLVFVIPLIVPSAMDGCILFDAAQLRLHSFHLEQLTRRYLSNMYDIGPQLLSNPKEYIPVPPACVAEVFSNTAGSLLQLLVSSSTSNLAVLCDHAAADTLFVWFYSHHAQVWKRVVGSVSPIAMSILNSDEYDIPTDNLILTSKVLAMQWVTKDILLVVSNQKSAGKLQLLSRLSEKKLNCHHSKAHISCSLPIAISYANIQPTSYGVYVVVGNDRIALLMQLGNDSGVHELRVVDQYDVRFSIRALSHATHSVRQVLVHDESCLALLLYSGLLVHMTRSSGTKIVNDYKTPIARMFRVTMEFDPPLHVIVMQCAERYFLWLPSYDGQQTTFGAVFPMIQHQNSVMIDAFDVNNALLVSYDGENQHMALQSSISVSLLLGLLNVTVEPASATTLQHALLKHQLLTRLAPQGMKIITALLQSLSSHAITDIEYILYTIIAHERHKELSLFISVVFAAHEDVFLNIMSRLARKLECSVNASLYPLPNFSYGLTSPAKGPWTQLLLFELCLMHNYVMYASRFLTSTCETYGGSDTPLSTVISLLLTTELTSKCLQLGNIMLALECLSFCSRLDLIALEHITSPVSLPVTRNEDADIYSRALDNVYSTLTLSGAQTLMSYMFGEDINTLGVGKAVPMVHLYNCSIANPNRVLQASGDSVVMAQGSYTYNTLPYLQQRIFDSCVGMEDSKLESQDDYTSNPKQFLSYTEALLLHYFDASVKNKKLMSSTLAMKYIIQSSIFAPSNIHVIQHRMINPLPIATPWNYAATTHATLQYICKIFGLAMLKPVSVALSADGKVKKYSALHLRRQCAQELSDFGTTLIVEDDEEATLAALLRSLLAISVVTQRMDIMLFVTLVFDRLDLALECWFRAANMQKLVDFCFGKQVAPMGIDYNHFSSSRTDVSRMKKIFHERNSMGLVDILHSIETFFQRDVPS